MRDTYSRPEEMEIELLLEHIYLQYGYDFRNYAFSTLCRRIWHRVRAERFDGISVLRERVLRDPQVMKRLINDFSIKTTEMFRDPEFFLAFREKAVPRLRERSFIRIWHAGCSSGEEVYSMAILLLEEGLLDKTRIYATDINEDVLKTASEGIFPASKIHKYTINYDKAGGMGRFSEYYKMVNNTALLNRNLVQNIKFSRHNLVSDIGFNEFDVIMCRNVFIYFNRALQEQVHRLFYESLGVSGYLGLGKGEDIRFTGYAHCYEKIHPRVRLYLKYK